METRRIVLRFFWFSIIVAESVQPLYAQLDTLGFPLAIGTKWFYRYTSKTSPLPSIRVKTVIDTTQDGTRIVRVTMLHKDSTLALERWIVKHGSFYDIVYPTQTFMIYNASLTHDTTWGSYYGGGFSYALKRATLLGLDLKSQTFSHHYANVTFSEFDTQYRVALGAGIFYHYYYTWGGESYSWTESSTLIGLLKDGRLYGDSLLITSVEDRNSFGPLAFKLEQNYPNPFNPSTKIKFQIPRASHVTLKVYNLLSQEVATLTDAKLPAGEHQVVFTPNGFASGMYFYRLESGSAILTKKMVLML